MSKGALVVLSGGQDSTTCLYWAIRKWGRENVHAFTVHYRQRHQIEIRAAAEVARRANVATHEILGLDHASGERCHISSVGEHNLLDRMSETAILQSMSPLVNETPVDHYTNVASLPGGLEKTFVPARNLLFLTLAANRAYELGVRNIVTGVCEEDFGGYPDCRQAFITLVEKAITVGVYGEVHDAPGVDDPFRIHTPLMFLTKKQSVDLARTLDGCMDALAYTHTCYDGCYPPHPKNHASLLRARGFAAAGVADPLIVRAVAEGLLPSDYPRTGLVEGTKYDDFDPRDPLFKDTPSVGEAAKNPDADVEIKPKQKPRPKLKKKRE